jgi:predicted RNA-binding Zn-ribbon protein involved in translation (DUF1610 family)
MSETNTHERPEPTCPHCGHAMTDDEMCSNSYLPGSDGDDLWGLAPNEGRTHVVCPSALCGKGYYVKGGYTPKYTSAVMENDLD